MMADCRAGTLGFGGAMSAYDALFYLQCYSTLVFCACRFRQLSLDVRSCYVGGSMQLSPQMIESDRRFPTLDDTRHVQTEIQNASGFLPF